MENVTLCNCMYKVRGDFERGHREETLFLRMGLDILFLSSVFGVLVRRWRLKREICCDLRIARTYNFTGG